MPTAGRSDGPFEIEEGDDKITIFAKKVVNEMLIHLSQGKSLLEAAKAVDVIAETDFSVFDWSMTAQWVEDHWTRGPELLQERTDAREQNKFRLFLAEFRHQTMPDYLILFLKRRPDLAIVVLKEIAIAQGLVAAEKSA